MKGFHVGEVAKNFWKIVKKWCVDDSSYVAEEKAGHADMPKSKAMLDRIGKLNLIVEETISRMNKIVKSFNLAWLQKVRALDLSIKNENGKEAEKNYELIRRLYTTAQPAD